MLDFPKGGTGLQRDRILKVFVRITATVQKKLIEIYTK